MLNVIKVLSLISPIVAGLVVVSFVFSFVLFVGSVRRRAISKKFTASCIVLILSLSFVFLQGYTIRHYLAELTSRTAPVEVLWEGRKINRGQEFVEWLSNYQTIKVRAGSRPVANNKIIVSFDGEELEFNLRQDSRDDQMYWLFYPDFLLMGELGFLQINEGEWGYPPNT